uniref:Uncharacterized protein n=1 Tax=Cacopsylla melanoneura TaxID=428564 RepID=A0A8D8Y5X5_9HEMI
MIWSNFIPKWTTSTRSCPVRYSPKTWEERRPTLRKNSACKPKRRWKVWKSTTRCSKSFYLVFFLHSSANQREDGSPGRVLQDVRDVEDRRVSFWPVQDSEEAGLDIKYNE